jgi:hypothetical protein
MAITTLDHIVAGAKPPIHFFKTVATGTVEGGQPHSTIYMSGMPGAAAAPTSALGGDTLTSYAGQLPMPTYASNTHLMKMSAASSQGAASIVMLCDRLWHNASITSTQTTAHTINSSAWGARDMNGSTNGEGVLIGIEVSTATSNGGAITNTTMGYTNSGGTDTRTATIPTFPATAGAGTFVPFALQAGDTGVRSIQSLTLGTSYGTGVIHLVAYRVIGMLSGLFNTMSGMQDFIQCGFPRIYDDSVPFIVIWGNSGANTVQGEIVVTQG